MGRIYTEKRGYSLPDLDAIASIPADFLAMMTAVDADMDRALGSMFASALFSFNLAHDTTGGVDISGWSDEVDDHGMVGASGFTAPVDGEYDITISPLFAASATGIRWMRPRIAGGQRETISANAAASGSTGLTFSSSYWLTAGQTVTASLYQNSGGTRYVNGRATMSLRTGIATTGGGGGGAELTGPIALAYAPVGTRVTAGWSSGSAAWMYGGVAVTGRPGGRADLYWDLMGAPAATATPAWFGDLDARWDVS